ncbi:MAG: hypothetical protein AAGF92_03270 [Myxococcota bacterium]
MQKFRSRFAALILFCTLSTACGDGADEADDDDEGGPPPPALVGTWTYQSVTVDETLASLGEVLDWVPDAVEARLQLLENGAFVYEEVNAQGGQLFAESGFVVVTVDEVGRGTIEFNVDGVETPASFMLVTDDSLVLTERAGTTTTAFTLFR